MCSRNYLDKELIKSKLFQVEIDFQRNILFNFLRSLFSTIFFIIVLFLLQPVDIMGFLQFLISHNFSCNIHFLGYSDHF